MAQTLLMPQSQPNFFATVRHRRVLIYRR